MAKQGNHHDFNFTQLLNTLFQLLASDPGSPQEGRFWYNSTEHKYKWFNGTDVIDSRDAATLVGQAAAFYLARANHTGTQAASTVSDLASVVKAYRLDEFAVPTASISLNSQKFTNSANGTNPQDLATVAQVEAARQGIRSKIAVEAAATGNVNVSNPGTAVFDGVTVANGEGLLLPSQTTDSERGIYVFNGSGAALTRRDDADTFAEVDAGTEVFVQGGTANGGKVYRQITELTGFGGQVWSPVSTGSTYVAGDGLTEAPAGQFNVGTASSSRIVVNGNDIDLAVTGIGAGTYKSLAIDVYGRATAGTNPTTLAGYGITDAVKKYSALFGDGSTTVFTYNQATHGLAGDQTLGVRVIEVSSGEEIVGTESVASNGTVTLTFAVAPTTNAMRVMIW